jgi:hypothetical protein
MLASNKGSVRIRDDLIILVINYKIMPVDLQEFQFLINLNKL